MNIRKKLAQFRDEPETLSDIMDSLAAPVRRLEAFIEQGRETVNANVEKIEALELINKSVTADSQRAAKVSDNIKAVLGI